MFMGQDLRGRAVACDPKMALYPRNLIYQKGLGSIKQLRGGSGTVAA